MGQMFEGVWYQERHDAPTSGGRFVRKKTRFHDRITADGSSGFKAESGRYHLYVSTACPWAHRTLIFRALKGLEEVISVSVVHWHMADFGWEFKDGPGCTPDEVNGARYLHEVYAKARPDYTGRVSVPILWDKRDNTIVNNESAEIIRMLNRAFDAWAKPAPDFYPEALRAEIDGINEPVYHRVNNGVYKTGFATTQEAYDQAFGELFAELDALEARLATRRYLAGERITEADWRLFTTLLRFDPVYHGHFKCNKRRLVDYPNLWAYTRELYQWPGVAETVDLHHIKQHYYASHTSINPHGIVPLGPEIDFRQPHDRGRLRAA